MISRYENPAMSGIWSDESRFRLWLEVETAVCQAYAEAGVIPHKAVETIRSKARIDVRRILEIEAEVKHDVIAFLTAVGETVGDEARFIHMGMTSSDVVDTAFALQLRKAGNLLLEKLSKLGDVLREKALLWKDLPCIGRTHGIHAQPVTFGSKILLWFDENERNRLRLQRAIETVSSAKISGAVGTYEQLSPVIEKRACELLGLRPVNASQIISRDIHAEFMQTLALIASSLEKIATEIRNLQHTEIREAEEFFSKGQKGSSAMPHKRNPVRCERVTGLARVIRGCSLTALENIALWHERDISHSSAERVIFPDACGLLDFMISEMTQIIGGLLVYPEAMMRNLRLTRGMIFSQNVLLALARKGTAREQAYRLVQECAMNVWNNPDINFQAALEQHAEISRLLLPDEISACFDLSASLKHIDFLFKRSNL